MSLTAAQQSAVTARGNVLVMAGAGTGKTSTLVARCIDCLTGRDTSINELLVVTFTEAAAAEARERIRAALEDKFAESGDHYWEEQLALFDTAHIGTLHSFCFKLVRQHFYELGLDPQVTVLDEGQARLLAEETLTALLNDHYAGTLPESGAVQQLIEVYAGGRDESIRSLVLRLHAYAQTRADEADWFAQQVEMFSATDLKQWREWLLTGIADWRNTWLPDLEHFATSNPKARECADVLQSLPQSFTRLQARDVVAKIVLADAVWPKNRKTELRKPLEDLFADAEFLQTLLPDDDTDPLGEDWNWCREPTLALLRLTQEFATRFLERKRDDGGIDFHDLEQLALQLLWQRESNQPSTIAQHWCDKFRFVLVDEYQDINAAQDQIIAALSGDDAAANRFLVGDVKQSIYRFRLADPEIFRRYAREWNGAKGQTVSLRENFRSRATILEFVNTVFAPLMRSEVGGVVYDNETKLIAGTKSTAGADTAPDVEILFRLTDKSTRETGEDALDDLRAAEREARHVAQRLRDVKASGLQIIDRETKASRPVEWRDMAVLLRAPSSKADGYARQFERLGIPLDIVRGGFYESLEVADLVNLLRLLDNPLQDVPLLAVLRSPFVGLTLDELATIRLAAKGHYWTALVRWAEVHNPKSQSPDLEAKVAQFLSRFAHWRQLARMASLSSCLDSILATTHYAEWLLGQERGAQRHANIHRFLGLAEQFDQFQRQGLFRFLQFIEAQETVGAEPETAESFTGNAVRLMSIHQSKGLEFPVVVLSDLGKSFNERDLSAEIVLDAVYGLCPRVKPPQTGTSYPSITNWLAKRRQKREMLGEELRLLYVGMTRAREKLILLGSMSRNKWETFPERWPRLTPRAIVSAKSCADWMCLWLAQHEDLAGKLFSLQELDDAALLEAEAERTEPAAAPSTPQLDKQTLGKLRTRLTEEYSFTQATDRAAKTSVTALRRQAQEEMDDEAQKLFVPRGSRTKRKAKISAADVGIAHHKFLQRVALTHTDTTAKLKLEATRLLNEAFLTSEEFGALDFTSLERFWLSDVGTKIRAQSINVRREVPFTARFAPEELDEIIRGTLAESGSEFVVVQGVADLIVTLPKEIWLLDFKTDHLAATEIPARTAIYSPQLQLYGLALERIFARPVTQAWLHFLATGDTAKVTLPTSAREFAHPKG